MISIRNLSKIYDNGHQALKDVSLDVREGEILALLGPNGAGKTTLISIVCGLVNASDGTVTVGGHDNVDEFRQSRALIGLVPQELSLGAFEPVASTVHFSRGLFGKPRDNAFVDQLLNDLSLGDKKDAIINQLSGGMKRRVLIAKALAHEPRILFLDEPTAGVDVELRKEMWQIIDRLRQQGVTIVLTTHYIEEAEEIADRVGVISNGELLVLDDKTNLMESLGRKQLVVELKEPIASLPSELAPWKLDIEREGQALVYTYDTNSERTGITALLAAIGDAGLQLKDLNTRQSSLEEIFINLVHDADQDRSVTGESA